MESPLETTRRELEQRGILQKKQDVEETKAEALCPRHKKLENLIRCRDCKEPRICPTTRFNRSGICKECVDRVCAAQTSFMLSKGITEEPIV